MPSRSISPPAPLTVTIPAEDGEAALALVQWAALRLDRGVVLTGPAGEADAVAEALREAGVAVETRAAAAPLRASWAAEAP